MIREIETSESETVKTESENKTENYEDFDRVISPSDSEIQFINETKLIRDTLKSLNTSFTEAFADLSKKQSTLENKTELIRDTFFKSFNSSFVQISSKLMEKHEILQRVITNKIEQLEKQLLNYQFFIKSEVNRAVSKINTTELVINSVELSEFLIEFFKKEDLIKSSHHFLIRYRRARTCSTEIKRKNCFKQRFFSDFY